MNIELPVKISSSSKIAATPEDSLEELPKKTPEQILNLCTKFSKKSKQNKLLKPMHPLVVEALSAVSIWDYILILLIFFSWVIISNKLVSSKESPFN